MRDVDAGEEHGGSNDSANEHLSDMIAARVSRRGVLVGGLAAGALGFLGGTGAGVLAPEPGAASPARRRGPLLGFDAVPVSSDDTLVVPDGYIAEVLIPWGQPILAGGPAWMRDASNTAAEQAQQVGMHHDGMHYFPLHRGRRGSERGLLVVNHEYVDRTLLYVDGDAAMTPDKVDKALAAHGVTVIMIERRADGSWQTVDSRYNRRITGTTPMAFSGPVAASHPMLASELGNPPRGTLNNCAHGWTPWGTYLACEENFNGYFGTADASWAPTPLEARYGINPNGFGYRWHVASPRFDLARNRNELNHFGWVVEIDPMDPSSTPVKRTALGRVKHEGAAFAEGRGRAVIYTGDDENGDYFYKFVGDRPWREHVARRRSPLDHGTLYVARFAPDGGGEWLPLVWGEGPLTPANGWADQADVLIRTRQAADALGATKLDRPEWSAIHPRTEDVYLALTNGAGWGGPGGVNPRVPNPFGHIVRLEHRGGDHTRLRFSWDVFVLAGDPAVDPTVTLDDSNKFGSPDGLWIDPDGRMWIETDISNSSQNRGGNAGLGNNAMLAADPHTGEIRRFLTGPRGAEITGVITTPDQRTMFINVQHPGERTTAWGSGPTPADPRSVSNWPDYDPAGRPRAATVVIRRADGGRIGA